MMDIQLPQIASACTSGATNAQSAPRSGQGGCRRESAGSGKSFSSELHEAHTTKMSRHEPGPRQTDHEESDASMSSDDAESSSTMPASTCASQDGQSCGQADEPAKPASAQETGPVAGDVTTQSLLLALAATPVAKTEAPQPTETASTEQHITDVESVMSPVKEDGTSVPVAAADSSSISQTISAQSAAKPTDFAAAVPSEAKLPATVDSKMQPIVQPDSDKALNSEMQPGPDKLPESGQEKQADFPKQAIQSNDPIQAAVLTEPVILQTTQPLQSTETQDTVKPVATQSIQRPDDNRPVIAEHQAQVREIPEPKENTDPKPMSATSTGSQDPTNQDRNGDRESSGQDHRERSLPEQFAASSPRSEPSAPAASMNSAPLTNSVDQHAFSSAPSAKLPADVHPAVTTPPVQPTDWMPGASASQTKSMVLELSQADLGRVNIRVAVNQDVVHTHFSSDRSDMSQYLQNGQERLQSALQTSGLDLGRFQVDLDRQSAGRSFQQPASQGQSHGRSPHEESPNQGQGREEFNRDPSSRRGKLNLVA